MHIIDSLFTYTNRESKYFYNCTLKLDIGKFKIGSVIDTIILDIENSELTFLPTSELDKNLYPILELSYQINISIH